MVYQDLLLSVIPCTSFMRGCLFCQNEGERNQSATQLTFPPWLVPSRILSQETMLGPLSKWTRLDKGYSLCVVTHTNKFVLCYPFCALTALAVAY